MGEARRPWYWQLHWQILAGMGLGGLVGALLGDGVLWIAPLGDVFLRLLRMVIVPLIFSSLVVGTTGLGDAAHVGRLGVKTFAYYVGTSAVAIATGLLAVNFIRPGVGANLPLQEMPQGIELGAESIGETLLEIVPQNPLAAMVEGNILAVIFFAMLVGLFTNQLPEASRKVIVGFVQAIFDLMMRITDFVIRLAPIGVFALMAKIVGTTGVQAFPPLLMYMLTVVIALADVVVTAAGEEEAPLVQKRRAQARVE
jgi:Na+/H+-dicarboxylate symporter